MKIIFFDTETTAKADFNSPPEAEHQPRLVQLACLLTDDSGDEISSVNLIIQPGVPIPKEASDIHDITDDIAREFGVSPAIAVGIFNSLAELADEAVAHNFAYDDFVMVGEARRTGIPLVLKGKRKFCTMLAMTNTCKLPGKYGKFKWPKLEEAYYHAFGRNMEGAHDAFSDVRACKAIYFWLKQWGNGGLPDF